MAQFRSRFKYRGKMWHMYRYKRKGQFRFVTCVQPNDYPECFTFGCRPKAADLDKALELGTYKGPLRKS